MRGRVNINKSSRIRGSVRHSEDCSVSQLVDIDSFIEGYSETKAAIETLGKFEGANSVKLYSARLQLFEQVKLIFWQILQLLQSPISNGNMY